MDQWLICIVNVVVASVGKFGGSAIAARRSGLDARDSLGVGILMNTRGLMELIVLNIGSLARSLEKASVTPPRPAGR